MEIIYSTTCAICAEKFRYPKHLSDHIIEQHPNIGQVNYFQKYLLKTPDPKFGKCLVCGEDLETNGTKFSFKYENGFRRHVHRKCSQPTLEHWKLMYGEEEGQKRWDSYCEKQAKSNSFEYKKEKYGWSEDDFENFNKSRAVSLKNMIAKYGEEEGTKKFNAYCEKQRETCFVDYYIEKYGEEKGREIFDNWVKAKGFQKTCTSIKSVNFFDKLTETLDKDNFKYGKNNEFNLYDKENKRNYFYDFVALKEKIIFEYNGIHFHAKSPDDPNFKNPFEPNLTAEEQYNKDKKKKEFAEANGYKLYYIWEDQPENEALNYCLEKLNEVCTN